MAQLLHLSVKETKITGLTTARSNGVFSTLEPQVLWKEIKEKSLDVCRIKINISEINIFTVLDCFPCPALVYSLNYHNIKIIPEKTAQIPASISWVPFSENLRDELINCLDKIYDTRSWPVFSQGIFSGLMPDATEKKLFIDFFSSFHPAEKENARTYFLKSKEDIVGIFMGSNLGDSFHGSLYGILPEFRGKGLSKIIYSAMDEICKESGLQFFKNEIHLLNVPSQKSAKTSDLVPTEIQANIILYPLLSVNSKNRFSVSFTDSQETEIIQILLCKILNKYPEFCLTKMRWNHSSGDIPKGNFTCLIDFPVETVTDVLAVCKIQSSNNEVINCIYFEFTL